MSKLYSILISVLVVEPEDDRYDTIYKIVGYSFEEIENIQYKFVLLQPGHMGQFPVKEYTKQYFESICNIFPHYKHLDMLTEKCKSFSEDFRLLTKRLMQRHKSAERGMNREENAVLSLYETESNQFEEINNVSHYFMSRVNHLKGVELLSTLIGICQWYNTTEIFLRVHRKLMQTGDNNETFGELSDQREEIDQRLLPLRTVRLVLSDMFKMLLIVGLCERATQNTTNSPLTNSPILESSSKFLQTEFCERFKT